MPPNRSEHQKITCQSGPSTYVTLFGACDPPVLSGAIDDGKDKLQLFLSEIRSENICDAVRRELAWNGWLRLYGS